jgi:hypothetical protein
MSFLWNWLSSLTSWLFKGKSGKVLFLGLDNAVSADWLRLQSAAVVFTHQRCCLA